MSNSSSSCGSMSSSTLICTNCPSFQRFSPTFDQITKCIPSFETDFNIPEFLKLVNRVEGTKEDQINSDNVDIESPISIPIGGSKFAGLVSSPDLLREKRNKQAMELMNVDAMTEISSMVETMAEFVESSAAIPSVELPNSARYMDMAEFPMLSREKIKQGSKNGAKFVRHPSMESIGTVGKTMGTNKEGNQVDSFPLKADLHGDLVDLKIDSLPYTKKGMDLTYHKAGLIDPSYQKVDLIDSSYHKADLANFSRNNLPNNSKGADLLSSKVGLTDLEHDITHQNVNGADPSSTKSISPHLVVDNLPIHGKEVDIEPTKSSVPNFENAPPILGGKITGKDASDETIAGLSEHGAKKTNSPSPNPKLEHIYIGNVKINTHGPQDNSNTFLESKRTTLRYIEPEIINGNVFVRPTWKMAQLGKKRWENTAVGYFLGKRISFMGVKHYVQSVWKGIMEVKATSNGFYFFKFESEQQLLNVLEGGPWMYSGQPLFLKGGRKACL